MSALVGDERGETLIELMITILVISIGMVTMVGVLGSSIIISDTHRGLSVGEVVIRDFGEAIKVRAMENRDVAGVSTYVPCPDTAQLDPGSSFTPPAGWNQPVVNAIEWWIPPPTSTNPNGEWSTSRQACLDYFNTFNCTNTNQASCDSGLQRVTFTVTNDRTGQGAASRTAKVVVRRANESTT